MTRLSLFVPMLDHGGAERVMLQLASSFAARGRDVDLVVGVPGGPLQSQIPSGIRVVDLAAKRAMAALPALVRYLRRERPRALLSTLEHSNILAVWAGAMARTGTRIVLREANVLLPREELRGARLRLQRALMRRFYRAASMIVAVSRSVADSITDRLGIAPPKVRTIYNPVITPALEQLAAEPVDDPWFAPGAPPVILGAGRLTEQKDFATLVRAFASVRKQRPARLLILGDGNDRSALETLVRELAVEPDVRLPGFDHNPFRFMQRSAVFALSSRYEGLPGVLIQAMACGCKVISTDCPGGSREILEDGRWGPLVPPGDPEALARGIVSLLDGRGAERSTYPLERFSERGTVDAYLDVLEPA